jgi:hypothetical protein
MMPTKPSNEGGEPVPRERWHTGFRGKLGMGNALKKYRMAPGT